MKIAITHPYSWPEVRRGAERITRETARALAARGHDVTLFSAGSAAERALVDGFLLVRFRRRFADPIRHERWFGARVVPALLVGHFDAVHSLMPYDACAATLTAKVAGHRTVYDEMGVPHRWWVTALPDRHARIWVIRHADVYGCMSEHALEPIERDWGGRGAIIPGGVRLAEFRPVEERAPQPTILFSGAIDEPRKGLVTLLDALALVAEHTPEVQLWLSGPGDPSDALAQAPAAAQERTKQLPLGAPKEQGRRYGEAWVTALPSQHDSFGLVLIESLASGTPIVVADHGAPLELVEPGVGAVSKAGDATSLAEALETALTLAQDPATAERCREVAARFDWDGAIAPLLEDLYAR